MMDMSSKQPKSHSSILLEFDQDAEHFGNQIPVRFGVEETELLMSQNEVGLLKPGLPLLVPAFATLGMACLRLCEQVGRAALDLDDYANELLFQIKGADVLVCSTMLGITVRVNFEELFEAWQSFAKHVKSVVVAKHPDKANYGYWRLIDDYPDIALAQELTRQSWFEERKDCFE